MTMSVLLCEGGVSCWLLLSVEEMRDFRVSYSYIYIGVFFGNFKKIGLNPSQVLDFFDKTQIRLGPSLGSFFLNPYPTLFLIGPGKIRPIRVGPGQAPAGWEKIAIPM